MDVQIEIERNKMKLLNNENLQPNMTTNRKHLISPLYNKQKQMLRKQLNLVRNKQVRAVPDGYYNGLINDMHKDYINFQERGTCRQMEYLNPLIQHGQQTADLIHHFNEETRLEEKKLDKFKAPRTLNALSIQCSLPSKYDELENLSPLSFLVKYTKPLFNRQRIVMKLIRKMHADATIDIDDAKDIVFEYFNRYITLKDIQELFHFLNIHSLNKFQAKEMIVICCYAERYFLHKLRKNETILFERPLQEIIDFEFLKRKLAGLKLTNDLKNLIKTLEPPANE
ncbi:unnamed protein product [Rotaria socialis]|uniref:Uncharacterized protein n=1 Tax=Rotaria socialis TaxID=392032 RepID=A0A819WHH7_9BILA|nr:unnamed protein product [Rotaria socialis]CAF3767400.1 unnamed protein product [Rotaria socialis]CAF4122796.1 unnamed protein product [Rotaria socialis]CAF4454348.1 unnamed protein product [Rotaria socialis]